jgi:rRNA maturation protein Nop10
MTRLTSQTAPMLFAMGSRMRQGKSECAQAIDQKFRREYGGEYDVMRTGFASALRTEVKAAIDQMDGQDLTLADRVKELCLLCGTDYDPDAPFSPDYPYGKQRALLQWWGGWRREQDPFYWINALELSIIERKPQIVLIDDMRYPNELFWAHSLGGTVVRVQREGYKAPAGTSRHASETALDGYEFDHTITSQEDQLDELRSDAIALFKAVVDRWSGAECASFFESVIPDLVGQER